jgi:exodeoxyribonuclease VII large subunit
MRRALAPPGSLGKAGQFTRTPTPRKQPPGASAAIATGKIPGMQRPAEPAPRREVYTVSRLNREARMLLEAGLPPCWIEGELSNFARPSSGHWYFTLKDADAQVRCAMFRNANTRVRVAPRDGMHVLIRARVSLYEARGEYQLIAEHLEEAGEGALRRRFEELKARLAAEGLFATELKRPLPRLPRRIGVVTSPTGAAIRDILHVLARRFPAVPVLIYPVAVQGAGASAEIAAAIGLASGRRDADVLILARGGGSLEDLWAFNEERVARAIRACTIPVVSGVGHEVDFTIADFAADLRAPTPSAAAEAVVPDRAEWRRSIGATQQRLARAWQRLGGQARERLAWLVRRLELTHPRTRLAARAQRLDELEARLGRALRRELTGAGARLTAAARTLNAVSPLATLERGYAIVTRPDGSVVRAARDVAPGDAVRARLAAGTFAATVTKVEP